MDYPFFTAQLGSISASLLAKLQVACIDDTKQQVVKHENFGPQQQVERITKVIPADLLAESIAALAPFVGESPFVGTSIDLLQPGKQIFEHTDLGVYTNDNFYKCGHQHCIHIPLSTNDQSLVYHRRSIHSPEKQRHLGIGNVYAFNNYVHHRVANDGTTDRVHLLFYFDDPQWILKKRMLADFKIKLNHYYEIP